MSISRSRRAVIGVPTSPEVLATELDRRLAETASIVQRMEFVRGRIAGRIAFSTSLGMEDQAVLHALSAANADVDIFSLDTGRHFPETLETIATSEHHFGLRIRLVSPDATAVQRLVAKNGVLGFRHSIAARKSCCDVRKVEPLRRTLSGAAGWITGLRRSQSVGRASVPFAAWDSDLQLIKINPIADWSDEDLGRYVATHDIPVNPLHARGFASIGCQPCTRAIQPGEDIRAGRWWWENEDGKECGLHNRPRHPGAAA